MDVGDWAVESREAWGMIETGGRGNGVWQRASRGRPCKGDPAGYNSQQI